MTSSKVPADFLTIQGAIDAAVGGDEIVVSPGIYNEVINFIAKGITVRSSDGAGVTTIDGTGLSDSVVKCINGEGPNTVLDGFTITGGTGAACNDSQTCGGGMQNLGSRPTVINCTFIGNTATFGGGMYNSDASNPMVSGCKFNGNFAGVFGGGMYNLGGTVAVTNCTFTGNTATFGGGMLNQSSDATVMNCTFSGNSASSFGGGIDSSGSSTLTVTNCILWGDTPDEIAGGGVVRFNNIQGGIPGGSGDGGGNIFTDPLFMDADGADDTVGTADDDLRLSPGSPAIDAADTPAFVGPALEIGGLARAVDDPATVDTGVALTGIAIPFSTATIDMGAHEFNSEPPGSVLAVSQQGLAVGTVSGTTWYVDDDSACPGAGTQADPFCVIQAGINASSNGDEIVVSEGSYNELIDLTGRWVAVRSSSGAGVTTIDGTGLNGSVVTCIGGQRDTILDGFTITGGTGAACGKSDTCGGGMQNLNASPTVINCTFIGNTATSGGGMRNSESSNPTVINCTFSGNTATSGGGMRNSESSNPTMINCTFSGNSASESGGGMDNQGSHPAVSGCKFNGNFAGVFGGGMHNQGSAPAVTNCTFTGNTANRGGGMTNLGNIGRPTTILNCTFSGNSASSFGGGIYNFVGANPTVTNCILWGDTPDEIAGTSIVRFSNIQGGIPGSSDGGGNISTDPLFMDADGADDTVGTADDDLRLSPGSPAIDAADTPAFVGPALDVGGMARAVDDPATVDTGVALTGIAIPFSTATIDMGAHESSPAVSGAIPAVSQWGLAVMVMLLLTAGTMIFARRQGQLG